MASIYNFLFYNIVYNTNDLVIYYIGRYQYNDYFNLNNSIFGRNFAVNSGGGAIYL